MPNREERQFYGLHFWGDAGPVNRNWTINHQVGKYNGRDIKAWLLLFATPTNQIAATPNISFEPVAKVRASLDYQIS